MSSGVPNATLSENSFYVGINLQGILYGVQLGLYFKTIHLFIIRRRSLRPSDAFYAVFSTLILILVTVRIAAKGIYGQRMWLVDRRYPGGAVAYGEAHASDVYMALGGTAVVVLQQMIDAFLIHRCRIVWGSFGAIVVPSVLWLANLAIGILVSWANAPPWFKFFGDISNKLGLAYVAISACLDVTLTCMIWYRLVCHARTKRSEAEYAFTVGALVMESLLPYTLCGIALLVSYGVGSETMVVFSGVYTSVMCVSSQMLILRVADGQAWQRDKTRQHGDVERPDSEGSGAVALVRLQSEVVVHM